MTFQECKARIKGNVVPVPGQFNADLSLNLPAYRDHVDFLLERGVTVLYLALSASQFDYMTRAERLAVTRAVCEAAGGRALVLAQPVGGGWIDEQVEEGRAMLDAGADALVVKPVGLKEGGKFFSCKYLRGGYAPQRHDDHFVGYMEVMAEGTGAPLVYHDKPFGSGLGLSLEGLERIVEIENTVCLKVHVPDPCSMQEIYSNFAGRVAMYDGFGKTLQFWSLQWGATGRHTCWSWFDPEGDREFFAACTGGDHSRAVALVDREWPLAKAIRRTGFRGYNEVMRLCGLPGGPVRIPGEELDDAQRTMLRNAARAVGLPVA
jgi:dihydrodipicolinate synthase/N-acetylneuraminate lyase